MSVKTLPSFRYLAFCTCIATVAIISLHCAHQMPPTGGPEDLKAPVLLRTDPADGATNVPKRKPVTITFSEWIDPALAKKNVSIFPSPIGGVTTTLSGQRLIIQPVKSFSDSITYHIEIGTGLKDLHNQSLAQGTRLIFSTGPSLDSAEVRGCIPGSATLKTRPKAALVRKVDSMPDSLMWNTPDYCTEVDSLGTFHLTNIHPGTYTLFGFIDADYNNRMAPGKEEAFAPEQSTIEISGTSPIYVLYPVLSDTLTPRISALRSLSATVLAGEWSAVPIIRPEQFFDKTTIVSDSNTTPVHLTSWFPIRNSKKFILVTAAPLKAAGYRFIYPLSTRLKLPDSVGTVFDTIRFNGSPLPDTTSPKALFFTKTFGSAGLKEDIQIPFSEAVRPKPSCTFAAFDSLGDTVLYTPDAAVSDTLTIRPLRRLKPGTTYQLDITEGTVLDFSGNTIKNRSDTPTVQLVIKTVIADNLCMSLSGGTPCSADPTRIWVWAPQGTGTVLTTVDKKGTFYFDSLIAGKGKLSFFPDVDKNGIPSVGSLFPWVVPEPITVFRDTVEARARWDIEGIDAKSCEPCKTP